LIDLAYEIRYNNIMVMQLCRNMLRNLLLVMLGGYVGIVTYTILLINGLTIINIFASIVFGFYAIILFTPYTIGAALVVSIFQLKGVTNET